MANATDELIPTRWSLIARLKDWQDETSWKDFFEVYWRLIYHTALKAGCTVAEAEEVVQETVIVVARKVQDFRASPDHGSFKGWLGNITRRRVIDQIRRRNRPGASSSSPADDESGTSVADQIPDPMAEVLTSYWDREWEQRLLAAAMERVKQRANPTHYQIFHLHVVQELPLKEVERALGVSAAQIYMIKHRVSAMVRAELKRLERDFV